MDMCRFVNDKNYESLSEREGHIILLWTIPMKMIHNK